jgi:putative flippase GtrA
MKDLFLKIFRFGIVGVIATAIDYGLMVLLTEALDVNYLISSAIFFSVSVVCNYILSVLWVFDAKQNKNTKGLLIFAILSLIGLGFNQALMYLGTEILYIHYMLTKIFATIIVMVYNFISRKIFLEKNSVVKSFAVFAFVDIVFYL